MKRYLTCICMVMVMVVPSVSAVEPDMVDYTAMPIFSAQAVPPNIMVVLDNSGSMNQLAYSDNYSGEPYHAEAVSYPVVADYSLSAALGYPDDMEELTGGALIDGSGGAYDLDLGSGGGYAAVGVRFQGVTIPQGAHITQATIEFTADGSPGNIDPCVLDVYGEAADDAAAMDTTVLSDISGRTPTMATVSWSPGTWSAGGKYNTGDLSAILQEIVDRSGWESGNAMLFRFSGTGHRQAEASEAGSNMRPVLRVLFRPPIAERYYGYFNPDYFYRHSSGVFYPHYKKVSYNYSAGNWTVTPAGGGGQLALTNATIAPSVKSNGLWDGNWLNWVSMRRIDVLRKVLMGGKATVRDGGGNARNLGEDRNYYQVKAFDSNVAAVSPYNGSYNYEINYGRVLVGGVNYDLEVEKDLSTDADEFFDGNLAGILQRVGDKARWGNSWFNYGSGSGESGGFVQNTIDNHLDLNFIEDLQNQDCENWTPLAETFFVSMLYFAQEDAPSGYDYPSDTVPNTTTADDPYYDQDAAEHVACAKSFVILLTDGASTKDRQIPPSFRGVNIRDYDGDGSDGGTTASDGTNYLDDLALFARTTDLRSDLDGDQNIILYTVYAFDDDPVARDLLKDAARNGGFKDRNGNNRPDGDDASPAADRLEWDEDGDGIPDTYFEANDGYSLETELLKAITDILKRTSSGTAASVLATNTEGAGNSVQAYFRPLVTEGLEEARWLGYLETLWVDPWGNLREDTNGNLQLDLKNTSSTNAAGANVDRIVEFITSDSDTLARRYTSHYLYNPDNGDDYLCVVSNCTVAFEDIALQSVKPLFEAGKRLADRDLGTNPRRIFTYLGSRNSPNADFTIDTSGDVILFDAGMATDLAPYLAVADAGGTGKWNDYGSTATLRAENLIHYIGGKDAAELTGTPSTRNRTLAGTTWRLGDIVHATPIVVSRPAERFQQLYNDANYAQFLELFRDRETMIYVGANDGMLHAFTNWQYQEDSSGNPSYVKPAAAGADELIGDEVWAYIPQAVLPHLKWYGLSDYTHTYFVDGEPRVFDAEILDNNTYYNSTSGKNYGTFLVVGLGMGGKLIDLNSDIDGDGSDDTMSPTYVMMEITNPREPRLVWERTYENMGMSYSVPAPVRVGDEWYLVFGSGPSEYDGTSSNGGYIYVVDMRTGAPVGTDDWRWGELKAGGTAYFSDPMALDIFQSANADAVYLANNYYDGGWRSDILKIAVPCATDHCPWDNVSDDQIVYDSDPANWRLQTFFQSDRPVSVKLASSTDPLDNVLLYFGTGRYLEDSDKSTTDQNYLYGVKDPFYNKAKYENQNGSYYHDFNSNLTLDRDALFQSDDVVVTTEGYVSGLASGGDQEFSTFLNDIRLNEDGWALSLITNSPDPSERIITRSAILGGVVLTPTYTPNADVCGMGGDTALVGLYYETGTGYIRQIFDIDPSNKRTTTIDTGTSTSTQEIVEIRDDKLLKGTPAPKIVFHVGLEGGATSKLQMSNRGEGGGITNPALYFRSIITEWWDNE
jgi:type IV pilus assembly protein PilY1